MNGKMMFLVEGRWPSLFRWRVSNSQLLHEYSLSTALQLNYIEYRWRFTGSVILEISLEKPALVDTCRMDIKVRTLWNSDNRETNTCFTIGAVSRLLHICWTYEQIIKEIPWLFVRTDDLQKLADWLGSSKTAKYWIYS